MKMWFKDALGLFEDRSLDFVYVDGYAGVDETVGGQESEEEAGARQRELIDSWYVKVKGGGAYGGHDYCDKFPVLKGSVDWFVKKRGLTLSVVEDSWWVTV